MRQWYSTQLAIAAGILTLIVTAFFALIQSPELLDFQETAAVKSAAAVPHTVEGRRHCNSCHGIKGAKPYPARHTGWSTESCMRCHVPAKVSAPGIVDFPAAIGTNDEKRTMAQPVPHPIQGMDNCGSCHGPNGLLPYPEDHSDRHDDSCTSCHMPAGQGALKNR